MLDSSGNPVTQAIISVTDASGNIVTGKNLKCSYVIIIIKLQFLSYEIEKGPRIKKKSLNIIDASGNPVTQSVVPVTDASGNVVTGKLQTNTA